MLWFRKFKLRDYVVITIFLLLQTCDTILTFNYFKYEINPIILLLGEQFFIPYKIIVVAFIILLYKLQILETSRKSRIIVELTMTVYMSTPIIIFLYQYIQGFV